MDEPLAPDAAYEQQNQQHSRNNHNHNHTHIHNHSHEHGHDHPQNALRYPYMSSISYLSAVDDQRTAMTAQHHHPDAFYHQTPRAMLTAEWQQALNQQSAAQWQQQDPTSHQQQQQQDHTSHALSQPQEQQQHLATAYHNDFYTQPALPAAFVQRAANPMQATALAMSQPDESHYLAYTTAPEQHYNALTYFPTELSNGLHGYPIAHRINTGTSGPFGQAGLLSASPTDSSNLVENHSAASSENGWQVVDYTSPTASRHSLDSYGNASISNPGQALHIRTDSNLSIPQSETSPSIRSFGSGSFEDVSYPMHSPEAEHVHDYHVAGPTSFSNAAHSNTYSEGGEPQYTSPVPTISSPSTSALSPTSPTVGSPVSRRKKSPKASVSNPKASKTPIKKASSSKKDANSGEKRVGRRRGPLRPDQRKQAGEIRKLRACLRCKFLKKTCDKGAPCAGCQPSHARLWQVPCTRIDIKDIGYFIKDWKVDFERHVTLAFSITNIKGYATSERPIWVSHGFGFVIPIQAREVYVRNQSCFNIDWTESVHKEPRSYDVPTAKLATGMNGVSVEVLNEYLDRHIDQGFGTFVDKHFEGTQFLTEMLKTVYNYYCRTKLHCIRQALKFALAYNLTQHVTFVEGLADEDSFTGRVDDESSIVNGKTLAPVMINFEIKCALAGIWRKLQKEVLEDLSSLYSSVFNGEKLKNWPTIFMLATVVLAVWEEMQFDAHYRAPDGMGVDKFCNEMEATPVGVVVGLFSAISQKLPAFKEWDTSKHHQVLNSNTAVCDAMTEIRNHVVKYENYLKSRANCKYDRNDFDCFSNKFLSKLVIRAN